jgi:hypothetical protein
VRHSDSSKLYLASMNEVFQIILGAQSLILVLAAAPTFRVAVPASSPAICLTLPAPQAVNAIIAGSVQYLVEFVQRPIVLNISLSTAGVQGPPGPPGVEGPRGSMFLGGYPSFSNLPVPDGINVKVGDFALVRDESAIYELE